MPTLIQTTIDTLAGAQNTTGDSYIACSADLPSEELDVLIFADSRGFLVEDASGSWALRLYATLVARGYRVMVVVRPRNLTGLFTLFNFLTALPCRFSYAVCQTGVGDFTPKTDALLSEMIAQKDVLFRHEELTIRPLDRSLVIGRPSPDAPPVAAYEQTWAMDIDTPAVAAAMAGLMAQHFRYTLLLGAVESDHGARFARIRPKSFFEQVRRSNMFLRDLGDRQRSVHFLEPLKNWTADITKVLSDGAHYTRAAHAHVARVAEAVVLANTVDA